MKKLLGIVVLGLLWCNVGFAEIQSFILNCSGESKTSSRNGVSYDSFFEDFTLYVQDGKINGIYTDATNHPAGRSGAYPDPDAPGYELEEGLGILEYGYDQNTLYLIETYNPGHNSLKKFKGTISLSSGRYSAVWEPPPEKKDLVYSITWDSVCKGADKVFAYINQIDDSIKGIDDNEILAASSGTGFFISNAGHMVTNNHVIAGCKPIKAIYDGKDFVAEILAVDKVNDLAIIKSNIRPKKIYPVATEDAQLLENVIIAGYPLGKKVSASIKATSGTITALSGFEDNYAEFQTDAALNSGNSGGPIIDENGNVIGVAVSKLQVEGVEGFNFGVKSSVLRIFANANKIKFLNPNRRPMKKKDLGSLIVNGTVYLECWMKGSQLKALIMQDNSEKAFYSQYKN